MNNSNFRKYSIFEKILWEVFYFLSDKRTIMISFLLIPLSLFFMFTDFFSGQYLIEGTSDYYYSVNTIGIHIAALHLVSYLFFTFLQEAITTSLDFITKKLAYENYVRIIQRHGVDSLQSMN